MIDNDYFVKCVYELVGDEYIFLEEYKYSTIPLKVRHNKCGHIYYVAPYKFVSRGSRCPN